MKCTVLYGPIAVGKLTIARELARLTSAKVLDNHQIIDVVKSVVSPSNPEFIAIAYSLQIQLLNAAMRSGDQDIIFTFAFSASTRADIALLQTLLEAGQTHNAEIVLVHLKANHHTLLQRVAGESRKGTSKITDPQLLQDMIRRYDTDSPFPDRPSIEIHTDHLSPQEVAEHIVRTTKKPAN